MANLFDIYLPRMFIYDACALYDCSVWLTMRIIMAKRTVVYVEIVFTTQMTKPQYLLH